MDLAPIVIGLIGLAVFFILVLSGTWIGFAAATVGILGIAALKGWGAGIGVGGFLPYAITASFSLSVIPLFILMGHFAFHAGLTRDLYVAARQWVGHRAGGLAVATCFASAGFAACSGSSTAAAAVMGKVAIPEMKKYNYDPRLTAGVVASSGTIASMIPPSVIMVVYGVIAEKSIAALLIAGIIPGVIEAILYGGMIWTRCRLNPSLGTALPAASWKARFGSLRNTWGLLVLIAVILGGLYSGVFTPTEAGGIGAFGAFLMALGLGRLDWPTLKNVLLDTGKTTAMIFVTIMGVLILLRLLALSGVTSAFIDSVLGLPWPPMGMLVAILVLMLILGTFIPAIGMLMLTIPLILPVVVRLGFNALWFGVIAVRMCEIAMITPPVGVNAYAVKAVAPDVTVEDIFRGCAWFLIMDFISLAFLIAFPILALFLPGLMK